MIDSFTSDVDFMKASQLTQNTKISGKTLANYFTNHYDRASTFERVFKIALRADHTALGDEYMTETLKNLRNFALKNDGKLPRSFTKR